MKVRRGTAADVPRALEIWRDAVDATHGFLTPGDRHDIDRMVAYEFLPNAELWLIDGPDGRAAGFLVMDGPMIDALFVDPALHAAGTARRCSTTRLRFRPMRRSRRPNRRTTHCRSMKRAVSFGRDAARPTRKGGLIRLSR